MYTVNYRKSTNIPQNSLDKKVEYIHIFHNREKNFNLINRQHIGVFTIRTKLII